MKVDARASVWPPRTLDEALAAELSVSTRSALERAGAMAVAEAAGRTAVVGLRQLIGGVVRVGRRERGTALVAARLVELLERSAGPAAVARNSAPDEGKVDPSLTLSPRAAQAIALARTLCRRTARGERIGARHLIVALVAPPEQPELAAALLRIWRRDWLLDPASLREGLLAALEAPDALAAEREAWRNLLEAARLSTAAFAADQPARDDALRRSPEARRLAELACLKANDPPLAIGLFGDWGSGKSSFMALMEREVDRLAETWRDEPASPFATAVARIRFNAWSFADSNLWASLAVEIFAQLRGEVARLEGGRDSGASPRADALLAEITGRAKQAQERLKSAQREAAAARAARGKLDERIQALDSRLAGPAGAAARATLLVDRRRDEIVAMLRALGVLDADTTRAAEVLAEEAAKIRAAGSGLFALTRRALVLMRAGGGMAVAAALGLAAVAAVILPGVAPGALAWAGTVAAFLAPLARHAARAVAALAPLLDAAEAEAKAEADLQAERDRLAAEREAVEARLASREAEARAAEAEIASLDRAASTPGAMLRFFLNESDELRAYEREIGLIGRLRRSFERLDRLMRDQADPATPTDPALPTVERIILFIDDLDRLREEQVVRVLEAVALLLQFRLFVVIVAVDARWLARSLQKHYGDQFGADGAGPGEYLEKIFQVPYWLPRLGPGDPGFAALALALMPNRTRSVAVSGEARASAAASGTASVRHAGGSEAPEHVIDPDELPQAGDEIPRETRAATVRRVELTPEEARALETLFPVAGSTPRAIKRFVNLYRLARSAREGVALDRWLGQTGDDPRFPAFALALALENGLEPRLRRDWTEAMRRHAPGDILAASPLTTEVPDAADCWSALRTALRRADSFWKETGVGLTFGAIAEHLAEARRLSFHPPELDAPHPGPDAPTANAGASP